MVHRLPRRIARAPIPLYLYGLGRLLGQRFILLEHQGRLTGRIRRVVLEVVHHAPGRIIVVSGYGPTSQWYRNIRAHPRVRVTTGGLRAVTGIARPLDHAEARAELDRYRSAHPRAAAALARALRVPGLAGDDPLPETIGDRLPVVEIVPAAQHRTHPDR